MNKTTKTFEEMINETLYICNNDRIEISKCKRVYNPLLILSQMFNSSIKNVDIKKLQSSLLSSYKYKLLTTLSQPM